MRRISTESVLWGTNATTSQSQTSTFIYKQLVQDSCESVIPVFPLLFAANEASGFLFGTQCNLQISIAANMRSMRSAVQVYTVSRLDSRMSLAFRCTRYMQSAVVRAKVWYVLINTPKTQEKTLSWKLGMIKCNTLKRIQLVNENHSKACFTIAPYSHAQAQTQEKGKFSFSCDCFAFVIVSEIF